jgi:hypothetical protein
VVAGLAEVAGVAGAICVPGVPGVTRECVAAADPSLHAARKTAIAEAAQPRSNDRRDMAADELVS